MAAPNTGGTLKTRIADMQVGDYIVSRFNASTSGVLGTVISLPPNPGGYPEIPLTGQATGIGEFYFIKVDKGLLVADRIVQHSISWDNINSKDAIQGAPVTLSDPSGVSYNFIFRSLGGGNSYASATGTSQTSDAGLGAWPTDNEWDTYIVKKDYGTGAGRDDVWHWSNTATLLQDTITTGFLGYPASSATTYRMCRGKTAANGIWGIDSASSSSTSRGFRPIFEYKEV